MTAPQHTRQAALRPQEMLLAHDLAQGFRAQPFGQRPRPGGAVWRWGRDGRAEQIIILHGRYLTASEAARHAGRTDCD